MPIKCKKGTKSAYRYKKGTRIRLGGCMKKGRFVKIKEVKKMPKKRKVYTLDSGKRTTKRPKVKEPTNSLFGELF